MRLAIVYKDDQIYVEIPPADFVRHLAQELNDVEERQIQRVIDRLIVDLKKKTLYK